MEPSTPIVFKLKDSHVACVGHLRELQRKIEQEFATKTTATSQNLDMGNFSIINLPDMSNDFTVPILGDSERTHAVRKQYLRENFATAQENQSKLNRNGDTMTGPLVLSQDAESDMQPITKRQLNDVETDVLLCARSQDVNTKTRQLGERIDVLDDAIVTKADSSSVYTKTAADELLNLKANVVDTYTKTQNDSFMLQKSDKSDTYTKTQVDSIIDSIPVVDLSPYATKTEVSNADALLATKTDVTASLLLKSDKTVVDSALATKKNVTDIDSSIQHSGLQSSVSCINDRYVSVKSMSTKLCDIHQDEVNGGCTLATYDKRFNIVSQQPQTFYHNATAGQFNFKYQDDANIVPGQFRFGQMQLAPSGNTTLNPAVTISSSRVNGLGTAGSIYLDSAYGQVNTPLILAPQSLTDANSNTLTMYRNTATIPVNQPLNVFSKRTGYATGVTGTQPSDFVTKMQLDAAITGVPEPDLSIYVAKSGSTMSGNLILSGPPSTDLMASTKRYVDDKVAGIVFPVTNTSGFINRDGSVRMNADLDMGTFRIRDVQTPALFDDAATKGYVDNAASTLQTAIDAKQTVADADTKYVSKSLPSLSNTLTMNSNKITTLAPGSLDSDATNLAQVNALISFQIGDKITQLNADNRYYRNTVSLSSISTATATVNVGGNRISNLGTPTQSTDAVTKAYADSLVVSGGGSSTVTNMIRSTDLSKTLVANANSIDFTNSGVTHLQIRNGEAEINTANWDLKTNSAGASNKLTFRSTGVPTQSSFFALNFNDGGDKKTRIGSSSIDTADAYLDYSLTNQQIQVPALIKLVRTDTSVGNVIAQEYVTRAYADSRIGSSFSRNDSSLAILKDGGVFVVSPNNDQTISATIAFQNFSGKLGLKLFYDTISRIAGSSYGLSHGLALHPDQDNLSGNKLVINKLVTNASGAIRYDQNVQIVEDLDLVTKGWSTGQLALKASSTAALSSFSVPVTDIAMNSKRLTGLSDPTDPQDGATKQWTLSQISSGGNQIQFGCRVLLGNVPFGSGSQNVVQSLAYTGANFPLNPSNIITGIDWVRQSGRSDTIRLRVKLDSLLVNGRSFVVMCQPETRLVNTSGGPTSDWQYGDSGNQYVMQTFNLDTINSRFYVHIRDISDTATELLYLNLLICF